MVHNNRIAYFWLKLKDYSQTGADPSDSEGLIDHLRDIEPVVVACLFEELEPESTRVTFRSKDKNVDVSEIAKQFGGGGHKASAGALITGKHLGVQRRVMRVIRKAIDAVAH